MWGYEVGITVADLRRRHGISDATFDTWRGKFGGLDGAGVRRRRITLEKMNG